MNMLYKKNNTEKLDLKLFENPTSEYRGAPFWAWNCKLEQSELDWQLEVLKQMGFGGAHFHVRTGMETPYLSEEYLGIVKSCVQKAKKEHMLAWLYDEDRWPSGAAGGLVTKEQRFRARHLLFTPFPYGDENGKTNIINTASARCGRTNGGTLLACFDVELDDNGYLVSSRLIEEQEDAIFEKWYAYLELNGETPWFNNQTYVNTLDKKAIDRFIDITYEAYNRTISDEFAHTVPAIFTDEPQFTHKSTLKYAMEKADVILPWTDDFPETFAEMYQGKSIVEGIPELIWDRADGIPSVIRYHYHDHVCERFTQAFADNCGKWCKEHQLLLTGHMMGEGSLYTQTSALSEVMRSYRSFTIPGIDMLQADFEYTTAKQAQSAAHQYGREGVMSELYGVTGWDFDFRGHKLHGDWQAALGVTLRVPHLAWVSMAGEAKRDFPASISYQSPWYTRYSLLENHFARLNTALTRGKPIVKVGVIHPIESYWLHWGTNQQTDAIRKDMDEHFQQITTWLLFGGIDFDFISESLFPELCQDVEMPIRVGEMEYDVIVVPGCETLRSTTLERLEKFVAKGGKVLFVGNIPNLENAYQSERGQKLAENVKCISFSRNAVLDALENERLIDMRDETGAFTQNLLYQLRQDGDGRWLFVAHGCEPDNKHISTYQDLRIRINGIWNAKLYNTQNGQVEEIEQSIIGDQTELRCRVYDYDSLLVRLEPFQSSVEVHRKRKMEEKKIKIPKLVSYTLGEPNVLLLDQAEYALDGEAWQEKEEILRLDDICRKKLGWPSRSVHIAQPWATEKEIVKHTVRLRFEIYSQLEYEGAELAIEEAENLSIKWNGIEVRNEITGWYVDKAIKKIKLPKIQKGSNILEAEVPFGKHTNIEWAYILGDFGVEVYGRFAMLVSKRQTLAFGDITRQGLPFYGGNITYHIPVETEEGELRIKSGYYLGTMQEATLDNHEPISMAFPPYTVELGTVSKGAHCIDITLYGHRRNGFGPLHLADRKEKWIGPKAWRSSGDKWCYEYVLCEEGVMVTPEVEWYKK